MADIFISYARADQDKVQPLAEALESKGWSVWWDARIRSGKAFDRVIEDELDEARCIIVVWSVNSVDSDWVRAEAGDGLERGILVSVAIERDVRPPLRFRNIHTELLIDWDGNKPSPLFDKIKSDVAEVLGSLEPSEISADKKIVHPEIGAMVEVPAGEFIYQDGKATIDKPYLIDVYPVTNIQFEKFVNAAGYRNFEYWSEKRQVWLKKERITEPLYWNDEKLNQADQPVVGTNFYEAKAFAKWAGKRLATEKEWERAARGLDGREYPWGDKFDIERCNTKESGIEKTTSVYLHSKGVSPVGCYDMAGNVWEWTASWYGSGRDFRVLRGGSWVNGLDYARCAGRSHDHAFGRNYNVGFRCAKDI